MPRPAPRFISSFGDKLLLLYAHSTIKSDKELAQVLGVKPSTLSEWVNGDDDRSRGSVPISRFEDLTAVLVDELGGRLSKEHASALWASPKNAFARALAGTSDQSFSQFLRDHSSRLSISVSIVDPRSMSLVDETVDVPEGAAFLESHEGVVFNVQANRSRCITVLYECANGWYAIVPGKRHGGHVMSMPERVPTAASFTFSRSLGLYRFVFIETETSDPIGVRIDPGRLSSLASDELEALQIVLSDDTQTKSWRWGEKYVAVEQQRQPGEFL